MVEFFAGAGANALGNLVTEYSSPYVAYFFRYGKIRKDFRRLRKQLELRMGRVENDVIEAIKQTQIIEADVLEWQKEAEEELRVTQTLADKIEHYKCFRWCPSWGWRYCLSMKAATKNINISDLLARSDFPRVGRPAPLQGTESSGSKNVKLPESSKLALNGIFEAVKKDDVSMIGVYGMPGVGKTTLAKEVENQARQKGFDKVVRFTVSQNPKVKDIQDRIAEIFECELKEHLTIDGRAEVLRQRLKETRLKETRLKEKNILIIADDVWGEINLQQFGIPLCGEDNGIKVLLTTRRELVCDQMNCGDNKFKIDLLSEDEAWALFKHNAGLKDVSSPLNDVAKEVARECNRLPLAIVTIAKTLKGESLAEWNRAYNRLKNSIPLDNPEVCEGLYECLEFSYDYLKVKNVQSCFLLCSLYPEDWDINIEFLTICAIGQGLFSDIHQSIESLRGEIRAALTKLQNSGLLLKSDDEDSVKMHDVVRDFAHWISSRGENRFMVKDGAMEWPMIESFGCHTAISLWSSKINYFPDKLEFSKLKTLILTGKRWDSFERYSLNVPSTFFKGMEVLRVLILAKVVFQAEAIQFPKSLRTLIFEDCKLNNVLSLENLEDLEILVLENTDVLELPKEVEELHRLKVLVFSNAVGNNKDYFPPNLLSRLTSLQELSVTGVNNLNLLELNSLSRLTALTLRVSCPKSERFPENFVFSNLSRFNIAVNSSCGYVKKYHGWRRSVTRTLRISDHDFPPSLLGAFKNLFCSVESLGLAKMVNLKNVVPNVVDAAAGGLNELTSLMLYGCEEMECLIDTTTLTEELEVGPFPKLVELSIKSMPCFIDWFRGQLPVGFLQRLERLEVESCYRGPILGVISGLQTLKDVSFEHCRKLQTLFPNPKNANGEISEILRPLSNLEKLNLHILPELEMIWELEPTPQPAISLQSLKEVRISGCEKLKHSMLFPPCLAQTLCHLQTVYVSSCNELEVVFGFDKHNNVTTILKAEHDQENQMPAALANLTSLYMCSLPMLSLIWKTPTHLASLGSLETLEIVQCDKLTYLFTPALAQTLKHLAYLRIEDCQSLEYLITESEFEDEDEIQLVSSCRSRDICCWPKLKTLYIHNCESLKYMFPMTLAQGLPCLETVEIIVCDQLMQVYGIGLESFVNGGHRDVVLPQLQMLRLENLKNMTSFCPTNYFVMLPSLKEFQVCGLPRWGDIQQGARFSSTMTLDQENQTLQVSNLNLHVEALSKLRLMWKLGPTHLVNLRSLKTMKIQSCDKLTYLFSPSLLQTLEHMELLDIEGCHSLERLISESEENDNETGVSSLRCSWPKLRKLYISNCESLKYVFPITLAQGLPCLETLVITDCGQLTQVFGMGMTNLEKDGRQDTIIVLPQLYFLSLFHLESLNSFGPTNYFVSLPSLEDFKVCRFNSSGDSALQSNTLENVELYGFKELLHNVKDLIMKRVVYHKNLIPNVDPEGMNKLNSLTLIDGKELECLIDTTRNEGHVVSSKAFNYLAELVINGMTGLKMLCNGQYQKGTLQRLEKLHVSNCLEMVALSPALQNIRDVEVNNCGKLQQVFQIDEFVHESEENQAPFLSNLTKLGLHSLPELQRIWEGGAGLHYVNLQRLTVVEISYCNTLQYLFSPTLAQSLVMLNQLKIEHCDGLQHIITTDLVDGHLADPFLPKLTTLNISDCPKLEYVLQIPSTDEVFPQLQSIWITDSPQLKQVFHVTKQKNGANCTIALPCLQELHLVKLINLSCFCSENYLVVLPSLKIVGAWDCPQLVNFTIRKVVDVHVKAKDVQLHGFKELLCNAKSLILNQAMYEKNLVPNVDPEGLNKLTSLVLNGGKELDCLIDTAKLGHVSTNAFFNLVELVIEDMAGLKMLCNGRFPKGFLQNVEKLETRNCMEMVSLSPLLQNLKEVKVINCGQLLQVFQIDEELLHDREKNQEAMLLSNLALMELKSLPELKWIWKGPTHYVSLQNLKAAYISHCHSLKYLFSSSLAQSLVLLENLRISHCNQLEHIITIELECADEKESKSSANLHSPSLPKLTTLSISHCSKLEYILQISSADKVLSQLQSISIIDSPQLRQVFNVAKEKNEVDGVLALPRLQELHLVNLINLRCFSLENYPTVLPSLGKLGVWGCPLFANFVVQQEVNEKVQLQELYLSDLGNDKGCEIINFQLRQNSVTLECITVANCEKIFHIQYGHYLSRVVDEEQNFAQALTFQHLRVLKVSKCNGIKSIFSFMLAQNLLELTNLVISHCEELEVIIEMDQTYSASSSQDHLQPAFFPRLRFIRIDGCNNLKSLFPISFTNSSFYHRLQNIVIHGASKLEQVFEYHHGEAGVEDAKKEIWFNFLKECRLLGLPSLKSFVSLSYKHFVFPQLECLEVRGCPKLNTSFAKDSESIVHAITKVPQHCEDTTMEEMVNNQYPTCNDIFWRRRDCQDTLPLYVKEDQTEDNVTVSSEENWEKLYL